MWRTPQRKRTRKTELERDPSPSRRQCCCLCLFIAGVGAQVVAATHEMLWEGCSDAARCTPASSIVYGSDPGKPWAGADASGVGTANGASLSRSQEAAVRVARRRSSNH